MPRRHDSGRGKSRDYILSDMTRDIKALNSAVLLISQKIKYLVRNEKILGRNLIVLNKKLKALESRPASATSAFPSREGSPEFHSLLDEFSSLKDKVNENSHRISELKSLVESMKENFVSNEKFQEMKYVIDAINPLEFVTLKQLEELLESKRKTAKKKKK